MSMPMTVREGARPLVPVLAAFVLLGILHAVMFLFWGTPKVLPDLPWVVPVTNALVMLSAWSVALLSLGRYAVRREAVSFWTGLAFAALGTGQVFYVLAWPGLLPDGQAIIGELPSSAAWIALLTLGVPEAPVLVETAACVWRVCVGQTHLMRQHGSCAELSSGFRQVLALRGGVPVAENSMWVTSYRLVFERCRSRFSRRRSGGLSHWEARSHSRAIEAMTGRHRRLAPVADLTFG